MPAEKLFSSGTVHSTPNAGAGLLRDGEGPKGILKADFFPLSLQILSGLQAKRLDIFSVLIIVM